MSEELNEVVTNQSEVNETPAAETPEVKKFSQAELDKIVAERVTREKKKLEKFADYDDLKTKLTTFEQAEKERQEAEMTELEKLQAQLAEKDTKEQTLAQQLAELEKAVQNEKIRNEFIKVATSQNIAFLDDAFSLADLTAVTVEDGKVVGMDVAIQTLVDNKPFLLSKPKPKPIGESSNGNVDRADKTAEQLLKEAAEKAKQSGRIEDKMAYAQLKSELSK
ncbi:phage scaffolding protein [Peribacillus huizhouensis]|uniref:Vacuolar-type H+-ATPase subunit I/STV1 n=1 Tax=Peribacillus huizhouensis TaxID=1501239 RepID=A0ABR6CSD8_9BACI|nr:Clp protease ClpB [Peribacillus huizhouensis]MBA9027525.1 vacuolar-type H+-ATPase subunit I/STV1 [Peribacillus huizhouensis]